MSRLTPDWYYNIFIRFLLMSLIGSSVPLAQPLQSMHSDNSHVMSFLWQMFTGLSSGRIWFPDLSIFPGIDKRHDMRGFFFIPNFVLICFR